LAFRFLLVRITEHQLQFTPDMKKLFTLTMLISLAMICSCQKQDSTAERQLAQRKAELDAREKALDESEKALAGGENPTATAHTIPPEVQSRRQVPDREGQVRDREELKAEMGRRVQQLPPDARHLIVEPSRVKANRDEKDARVQERLAQQERTLEERQRMKMSGREESNPQAQGPKLNVPSGVNPREKATFKPESAPLSVYPQPEATSQPQLEPLSVYPQAETTSPTPSPTPTPQ
jgi:hypothetical protein